MFSPIIGLGFNKGGKKRNDIEKIVSGHVNQGAKEFFCGYNPPYWHNKFGFEVSTNGRFAEHEQINSFESLQEVVSQVHKYGKKIMGNINHWYYTDVVQKEFEQMIQDFLQVGIDGFIVSSMGTLEYLEQISEGKYEKGYIINGKKIQLNISTIMAVYNSGAINYLLENYPVAKVILSREVSLKEIEHILQEFPELTFEVFGEGDFCRYNNGLCFAEHKYTDRDICTIVVNDLLVKKTIKYDFRKIINDKEITNNEKVKILDNEYKNDFEQLDIFLQQYDLDKEEKILDNIKKQFIKIIKTHIIFYDPLQGPRTQKNIEFNIVFQTALLLKNKKIVIDNIDYFDNIDSLFDYLQSEKDIGTKQYQNNLKQFVGERFGVNTKYKDNFYNRADNLNLYSYIFFDKFDNIDTVKFPTRGRNYLPKIQLIDESVKNIDKISEHLDLNCSYERAHYDLRHLFKDNKFWFYDLRKILHNKIS